MPVRDWGSYNIFLLSVTSVSSFVFHPSSSPPPCRRTRPLPRFQNIRWKDRYGTNEPSGTPAIYIVAKVAMCNVQVSAVWRMFRSGRLRWHQGKRVWGYSVLVSDVIYVTAACAVSRKFGEGAVAISMTPKACRHSAFKIERFVPRNRWKFPRSSAATL